MIYMGDRFGLFELLSAGLCAIFFFSLSFRDKKGGESFGFVFVIDVFDKGSSIFLIDKPINVFIG
jgi:hypothetical protein